MVPSAALAGLVAPITSRYLAMAFSPSSTCTTTGAETMKLDELAEEGPLLVDGVEGFGLLLRHADALLRDDAQTGLLDDGIDGAGEAAVGRIRLDDGKGCARGP